jgi:hypothetical protein
LVIKSTEELTFIDITPLYSINASEPLLYASGEIILDAVTVGAVVV